MKYAGLIIVSTLLLLPLQVSITNAQEDWFVSVYDYIDSTQPLAIGLYRQFTPNYSLTGKAFMVAHNDQYVDTLRINLVPLEITEGENPQENPSINFTATINESGEINLPDHVPDGKYLLTIYGLHKAGCELSPDFANSGIDGCFEVFEEAPFLPNYQEEIQDLFPESSDDEVFQVNLVTNSAYAQQPPLPPGVDNIEEIQIAVFSAVIEVPGNDQPLELSQECCSNVAFIHGLQAAHLYLDDDELWVPNSSFSNDLSQLHLDSQGNSVNNVTVGEAIDQLFGGMFQGYQGIFETLDEMKGDEVINDWQPLNYDWRFDPETIVTTDIQLQSGDSYNMVNAITDLVENSQTEKVTIITHSYGGLVAKALVDELEKQDLDHLVDQIIFTVPPFTGTPKAIGGLLHGTEQELGLGFITTSRQSREFANNMPSGYVLLPSQSYFDNNTDQVKIEFSDDPLVGEVFGEYGPNINNYDEFIDFLKFNDNQVLATSSDIASPATINFGLLHAAQAYHDRYDNWSPENSDIDITTIIGEGFPTTTGWIYEQDKKLVNGSVTDYVRPRLLKSLQGDQTVMAGSGAGVGEVLYFDQDKFDEDKNIKATHAELFRAEPINKCVSDLITDKECSSQYIDNSLDAPDETLFGISVHSPISIMAIDGSGNKTGIDSNGNKYKEIPGSYVEYFAGSTYIYLPTLDGIEFYYDYNNNPEELDYASASFVVTEITNDGEEILNDTGPYIITSDSTGSFTVSTDKITFEPQAETILEPLVQEEETENPDTPNSPEPPTVDPVGEDNQSGSGGGSILTTNESAENEGEVLGQEITSHDPIMGLVIKILQSSMSNEIKRYFIVKLLYEL